MFATYPPLPRIVMIQPVITARVLRVHFVRVVDVDEEHLEAEVESLGVDVDADHGVPLIVPAGPGRRHAALPVLFLKTKYSTLFF